MIEQNIDKQERYLQLKNAAQKQLKMMNDKDFIKALKRLNETTYLNKEIRMNKK